MTTINRRMALKLSLMAGVSISALSRAKAQTEATSPSVTGGFSTGGELQSTLTIDSGADPVLFWNGVSLDLVAYDHSIPASDSRAPGPCATSYALGFVHAVIADAVKFAYGTDYNFYFAPPAGSPPTNKALFVGGAAAGVLAHIYNTDGHVFHIDTRRQEFFRILNPSSLADWFEGLNHAKAIASRKADVNDGKATWDWSHIRRLLLSSTYSPKTRGHNIDPLNPSQDFYGSQWGNHHPFIDGWDKDALFYTPEELKPFAENSPEYIEDLNEVQVKGRDVSDDETIGGTPITKRTEAETNVGYYWAYDGPRLIGTPPRLYNQIVRLIAIADGLGIQDKARLLALCNIAMADAGIATWFLKYHSQYVVWRPILGVRNRSDGETPHVEWRPLGAPKTNKVGPAPQRTPAPSATAPSPVAEAVGQTSLSQAAALSRIGAFAVEATAADIAGAGPTDTVLVSFEPTVEDTAQSLLGAGRSQRLLHAEPGPGTSTAGNAECQVTEWPSFSPNFPAFPSGHATFGSACFEVVKAFRSSKGITNPEIIGETLKNFRSDELDGTALDFSPSPGCPSKARDVVAFDDYPRTEGDTVNPLSNLDLIIRDNARSRVFLGVHWQFDADVGVKVGKIVAGRVKDNL
ncbi:hypothetical protein GOB27_14560 [Sinorhizobium meliloti]|nr:hypothetical protein [Sinorhizobium meliloti]